MKLALFEPELKFTLKKITVPDRTEALFKTNPNYYIIKFLDRNVDIYCKFKNVKTKLYIFIYSILSLINNVSGDIKTNIKYNMNYYISIIVLCY